jgi:hypothetical protein
LKNLFVILVLLSLGLSSSCFSIEEKTSLNKRIIENFFRSLFSDEDAGYVLFGNKPVFLSSAENEINLILGTQRHKRSIETRAALDVWKGLSKEPSNYILKTTHLLNETNLENEFLLINKKAFLNVVQENLHLFSYRLGFQTTPENLLFKLLDPQVKIGSLFTSQITLLGSILGYGTQNAIVYDRGTTLIKSVAPHPFPPYQQKPSATNEKETLQAVNFSKLAPSFGFSSIKDESDAISQIMGSPETNLDETATKIVFSYLKNSEESKKLLLGYKEAQKTLDQILAFENFLEPILERFQVQKVIEESKEVEKMTPHLLARSIRQTYLSIYPEEKADLEDFISGMQKAEESAFFENVDELMALDILRERRLCFPKTRMLYELAEKKLKKIAKLDNVYPIEENKIYFRTLKKAKTIHAQSKKISKSTQNTSMQILIQDLEGKILFGTYHLTPLPTYKFSELIPGLAYGMIGMAKGEVREIWIHPNYIYGIESDFAEGAPIKITVKLIDLAEGTLLLPELIPFDFKPFQTSNESWASLIKKYHLFSGYRIWSHIKKSQAIALDDLIYFLRLFRKNPDLTHPLNEHELSLLIRFHWLIYNPS